MVVVSVAFSDDEYNRIKNVAFQEDRPISSTIRIATRKFLNEYKVNNT